MMMPNETEVHKDEHCLSGGASRHAHQLSKRRVVPKVVTPTTPVTPVVPTTPMLAAHLFQEADMVEGKLCNDY